MRNIALFLSMLLIISCAPGKSDNLVRVDVYCDSCFVNIENGVYADDYFFETVFDGNVFGYKRVEVYRYSSGTNCLRMKNYYSYTSDTIDIYFIENGDTINQEHNLQLNTSFCY